MKPARILFCLIAVFAIRVYAEPASKPTTSTAAISVGDKDALDAAKDKQATVEGTISRVSWSKSGSVMFINFDGADETKFTAVVFKKDKEKFDKAFGGDATTGLPGAKVQVTGKIETYRDKPEIKLDKPTQIKVIQPPASQPA
jgi:DNA/RNA endonuclease YhcR with UshA esterase domain